MIPILRRRLVNAAVVLVATGALVIAPAATAASRAFDAGSWGAILKAHAGKPLVVHFWGLTCAPCLVELPDWAKLERASTKAKFVYVQAEQQPPAKGSATLAKSGLARSEQWTFVQGTSEERLRFEVDPRWRGELPKTVLVAPDGTVTPMRDGTDFAKLRAWLDEHAR